MDRMFLVNGQLKPFKQGTIVTLTYREGKNFPYRLTSQTEVGADGIHLYSDWLGREIDGFRASGVLVDISPEPNDLASES